MFLMEAAVALLIPSASEQHPSPVGAAAGREGFDAPAYKSNADMAQVADASALMGAIDLSCLVEAQC
ncbi:hypothetical protein NDU88_003181 [Pleurodeles waltl]|uniref:Uncharacterized protein n=1 Tax=Pleurodeles waltl TaxID=8319 RepID=A0AAV7KXU1_PLEWA|nr:hypothetical protein NDU88_003181 [Pleurodeles waltl]